MFASPSAHGSPDKYTHPVFARCLVAGLPQGCSASPVSDDNVFEWDATVIGPEESPWEGRLSGAVLWGLGCTSHFFARPGGMFSLKLVFPQNYPDGAPKVRFTCEMFHPNGGCFPAYCWPRSCPF